ncbi:hypothetical protein F2Q69_00020435 [Brassica cretica]|uniref:Uncharacterized protein n=1 Tax=Brassica cretica TaxID=69181 RepID=A0A8S9Q5L8_BRACR|nr:hypothetical protein F2Q69_00020435 [Brassica cretica]
MVRDEGGLSIALRWPVDSSSKSSTEAELFKGINGEKEHEYMRGISAWNFDLQDLRKQASLNPDNEMCSSESQDVGVDVPKRNPMIQRSKTMSLEMFKISDKAKCLFLHISDLMSASNSLTIGPLLPSFRRKFLPAIGGRRYKVGILSDESNACRQRAAEALALEEPNQLELLAVDTKQTPALEELHQLEEPLAVETKQTPALEESHQVEPLAEKPKNGYTVSSVSRCAANEVLPLLQSLLVQNDIQREKVIRLIRFFDGTVSETQNPTSKNEAVQIYPSRERELQSQVNFLEQSVEILVEEVKRRKEINDQLEEQIRSLTSSSSRRSSSRSGA